VVLSQFLSCHDDGKDEKGSVNNIIAFYIDGKIRMGTKTYLAHLLYWKRRNRK